jgi:hypothetical protein
MSGAVRAGPRGDGRGWPHTTPKCQRRRKLWRNKTFVDKNTVDNARTNECYNERYYNERCYNERSYNERMLQRTMIQRTMLRRTNATTNEGYNERCYNERFYNELMVQRTILKRTMLQRKIFVNKSRMLQRTRSNTIGRRCMRVRMTCRAFPLWLKRQSPLLPFVRFSYQFSSAICLFVQCIKVK